MRQTQSSELTDAPEVPLPGAAGRVARDKPEVWEAFQKLGAAAGDAGPLDERTPELRIVDMPGYGYASAPKTQIASWTKLIHNFLLGRASLARVYVLIDSRHGFKDADNEVLTTLDKAAVSYQIVLTKADQVKKSALEQTMAAMTEKLRKHPAAFPDMLVEAVKLSKAGKRDEMHDLFDVHLPLLRYDHQPGVGLAVRKYVLQRRGVLSTATMRKREIRSPNRNTPSATETNGLM